MRTVSARRRCESGAPVPGDHAVVYAPAGGGLDDLVVVRGTADLALAKSATIRNLSCTPVVVSST